MDKLKTLKDIFGHSYFRAGQEQAVDCLLSGRDLLAVMPTGAGKSVCYQLPAVMRDGITLVVSPLISLMQDQALSLTQNGVAAAFLNSSLSHSEFMMTLQMAEQGAYKILFVAPERLETETFRRFAAGSDIAMVIVDEAHCVSQWGQDFRPSYLKIPDFINSLAKRPVVGAFTATATEKVREDIKEKLRLKEPMEIVTGFDRPNLYFEVIKTDTKSKPALLAELLKKFDGKSGIVYCSTRKQTEQTLEICRENGVPAAMYHAGMSDADRSRNQDDFIFDRIRVITATNAFGMGIDKSNVGFVIHYNMPKSPEAYYQEAGRAGRDGTAADCVLLYSPADVNTARYFIDHAEGEGLTETEVPKAGKKTAERYGGLLHHYEVSEGVPPRLFRGEMHELLGLFKLRDGACGKGYNRSCKEDNKLCVQTSAERFSLRLGYDKRSAYGKQGRKGFAYGAGQSFHLRDNVGISQEGYSGYDRYAGERRVPWQDGRRISADIHNQKGAQGGHKRGSHNCKNKRNSQAEKA